MGVSAGWRIGIADSYSAGGKCEEENTRQKGELQVLFKIFSTIFY